MGPVVTTILTAGIGTASYAEIAWTLCAALAIAALLRTTQSALRNRAAVRAATQAAPGANGWRDLLIAGGNVRRCLERLFIAFTFFIAGINSLFTSPSPGVVVDSARAAVMLSIVLCFIAANGLLAVGAILDLHADSRLMRSVVEG